jgi:hypothetical protein
LHQEGNVPAIAQVIQGAVIGFGESQPNREFDRIVDQTFTTRFNIGIGRSVVSSGTSQSRTGSWSVQSQCVATVTFSSSDNARFFFNSGGKLRFTSTRTGGVSTAQNNAWTEAKSNVSNNSVGGATVIDFRITWRDDYTDPGPPAPGDLVDGTLTISIEEFKATGSIVPSGSFTISSPSYSITPITAS